MVVLFKKGLSVKEYSFARDESKFFAASGFVE